MRHTFANNINIELFKILSSIVLFTKSLQFVSQIVRNRKFVHSVERGDLSPIF